jgi:hypothetical protein
MGMGEGSWLTRYMRHTETLESPSLFHRWIAIAAVGHVLGRKVWVTKEGTYGVFPGQLMVVLVSPSAIMRKSTAVGVGLKLLTAVEERTRGQGVVNRIADRGSPQSFLEQMRPMDEMGLPKEGADCVALITASELGAFLSNESWNEQLPTFITALNDAPVGEFNDDTLGFEPYIWRSRFVSKVPYELKNPCVGMMAATTPTGLAKEIPHQAQLSGFFGRVIWVYAEETDKKPNSMTRMRPRVVGLQRELVEQLAEMGELAGPVRWQKEAREWHDGWYEEYARKPTPKDTGLASGFHSRKQDHILRVATVLAAMDGSVSARNGSLVLQLAHLTEATKYIDHIEKWLPRCFMAVQARGRIQLETKLLQLASRHQDRWLEHHFFVKKAWYYGYNTPEVDAALTQLTEVKHLRKRGGPKKQDLEWKFRPSAGAMLKLAKEAEGDEGGDEA